MVNKIIDGISVKLNQAFGDTVRIYSENVTQGLTTPCFFISTLNVSQDPMLGTRAFRNNLFDVHYFPAVPNSNSECETVASDLYDAMDNITLLDGDILRGTKMHHEVVEGVLHFFVNYNLFVNKVVAPGDGMDTVVIDTNVKG